MIRPIACFLKKYIGDFFSTYIHYVHFLCIKENNLENKLKLDEIDFCYKPENNNAGTLYSGIYILILKYIKCIHF